MIHCSFYGLTNSRCDCATTWGKYLPLFVFYAVKCHWYQCLALLSTITTWPSLTWTNMLLSFKFLCNFLPPPSFYSLAVTFTRLSVGHTPCFTLPGLVVFKKISLCFTWIQFHRSLWYALFVHFSCLFLLHFFCLTVSCDSSDHQAMYFDHSQDGTVCSFYSFQSCPDLLLFLFFISCLLLPHTSPSEIILFSFLSIYVKDIATMKLIK